MMKDSEYGICGLCGGRRTIRPERKTKLCASCSRVVQKRISGETWMTRAACHDPQYHPEWWTGGGEFYELATRICREHCPVREACLRWALGNDEREHVYGGVTPQGRAKMLAGAAS